MFDGQSEARWRWKKQGDIEGAARRVCTAHSSGKVRYLGFIASIIIFDAAAAANHSRDLSDGGIAWKGNINVSVRVVAITARITCCMDYHAHDLTVRVKGVRRGASRADPAFRDLSQRDGKAVEGKEERQDWRPRTRQVRCRNCGEGRSKGDTALASAQQGSWAYIRLREEEAIK